MTETERLLIDNLERHRAGDAATANLIADAAATIRCLTAERDALRKHADAMAGELGRIVEHCANTGYGNAIVNERIVDRCDETARQALAAYTAYLIDGEEG